DVRDRPSSTRTSLHLCVIMRSVRSRRPLRAEYPGTSRAAGEPLVYRSGIWQITIRNRSAPAIAPPSPTQLVNAYGRLNDYHSELDSLVSDLGAPGESRNAGQRRGGVRGQLAVGDRYLSAASSRCWSTRPRSAERLRGPPHSHSAPGSGGHSGGLNACEG